MTESSDLAALLDEGRQVGVRCQEALTSEGGGLRPAFRALGDAGVLGAVVAKDLGGRGLRPIEAVHLLEGLGLGCTDVGVLFAAGAHLWGGVFPLALHGTAEQIGRHLPALLDGTTLVAHGVTEPGAGSDVNSIGCRIDVDGDRVTVTGSKRFVTLAPVADLCLIYGRDGRDPSGKGLCSVVVESATPGLRTVATPKMGLHSAPMGEIHLDHCVVDAGALIGPPSGGMAMFQTALEWERAFILAPMIGAMQRQLDRVVRHARSRKQFGQPISRFQAVSHRIVEMKLRLDHARLVLHHVARLKDGGGRAPMEAAAAKLVLSETFLASSLDAVRVFGTAGYLAEAEEARDVADALGGPLFSGTSDIQKNIIGRYMGL